MILTRADVTRCMRCNLDRSFIVRPGGVVEPVCVCCHTAFQNGTLLDCQHGVVDAA